MLLLGWISYSLARPAPWDALVVIGFVVVTFLAIWTAILEEPVNLVRLTFDAWRFCCVLWWCAPRSERQ